MKVRTDLKTGSLINDLSQQAKQIVSTATGYLTDAQRDLVNYGQNKLDQARQAWIALIKL